MAASESRLSHVSVRCARVVATAFAIAFTAHGVVLGTGYLTGCVFRSAPRWLHAATYHETFTMSMATCLALSGLFHVSVAWRLWMFARLIGRSPGPAFRRLAKAAWISFVLYGIVGVWGEIAHASYICSQNRVLIPGSMLKVLLDPTRAVWLVMHVLAAVLSVWVARVATESAREIEDVETPAT